jgi:hypothetical protein
MVLVEGKTEEIFVNDLLRPYMAPKNIYLYPNQISKLGQKGNDDSEQLPQAANR